MVTLPVALRPWARWGLLFHFCDEADRHGHTPFVALARTYIAVSEEQVKGIAAVRRRGSVVAIDARVFDVRIPISAIASAGSGEEYASVILQGIELIDRIIPFIPILAECIESLRLITCPGRPG